MRAVVCTRYGGPEVLRVQHVRKPVPAENEVLIKVHATSAHVGDTRIRRADPFLVRVMFGLFRPKKNLVLGLEVSGVVEAVGARVRSFREGDAVFAWAGFGLGGYGEYICLPAPAKDGTLEKKGTVAAKPKNLTHAQAAVVPAGALTALKNLHKVSLQDGQHILINGASGSLGTYAIQLAKHYGAEVTAVCSRKNFELVTALGASHTIDYREEDFTQGLARYDVVYDAVMKSSRWKCRGRLKKDGVFLNNQRLPKFQAEDLEFLKERIEEGCLTPVMDRIYSLKEAAEAHRYVDLGHKRGNVALFVPPDWTTESTENR